ncbi:uncharacterized protein LOC134259567 [Saccostrea cucullata]|uniref:uncharacterized protein LOC134259567 n=1 Tax=Saccostrea cuccullata TaxID=36930 RepID=UPI002ED4B7F3
MAFRDLHRDIFKMLNHSAHAPEMLAQLNSEEVLNRLPLLLVLSVLSAIGIIANTHVLFVFGTKIKRSTYRVFVLALGCIDMLGCMVSIPFQIIDETNPYTFNAPIACKIFRFFDTNLAIAAALMLVVIAAERFRKICRPNGLQVTEKRAIRSIIAVIIGSSIATSPALLIYGSHTVVIETTINLNGTECSWSDAVSNSYYGYIYYALELLIVISCMVCLTILYSFVGKALRAHNKRMKSTRIVRFHVKKSVKSKKGRESSIGSNKDEESAVRESIESTQTDRDSGVDSPAPMSSDSLESLEIEIQIKDPKEKESSGTIEEEDDVFTNKESGNDKSNTESTGFSSTCKLCEGDESSRKMSSIRYVFSKVASVPETLKGFVLNRRGTSERTCVIPDIIVTDCANNTTQILIGSNKDLFDDKSKTQDNEPNESNEEMKTKKSRKPLKTFLRKRKKSKTVESIRERRITKLLFFITLTFIVTYYPYIIVLIIYAVKPEFKDNLSEVGRVFYLMAIRLYLINNVMNAFFYGMGRKVAVVTGANRGLGLELVRQLCKTFDGDVILTSRMSDKGNAALNKLKVEGLRPRYHELDITQAASIRMFEDFIKSEYGGIDVLINNAAVTYKKNELVPLFRQAQLSIETDFKGTLNVCRILLPHMHPHGRVVLITNGYIGKRKELGEKLQQELDLEKCNMYKLITLADEYMKAVKYGNHKSYGWPDSPCVLAKIFLSALARVLTRELAGDVRRNILINACCPGWMTSQGSEVYVGEDGTCQGIKPRSVEEAAKDVVWLATLPEGTKAPNGQLVRYREVIPFE